MREIIYHPDALYELLEAGSYLEFKRPGYGEKFEAAVDAAIDHVLFYPEAWIEFIQVSGDAVFTNFHMELFFVLSLRFSIFWR